MIWPSVPWITGIFFMYVYSTLHYLPPLSFHCVGGYWMGSNPGHLRLRHWLSDALTTRLHFIHSRLHVIHNSATSHPHSATSYPHHGNINGTCCTLIRPTVTWLSGIFTEPLCNGMIRPTAKWLSGIYTELWLWYDQAYGDIAPRNLKGISSY